MFVDIRPDTLNLDERRLEVAITPRTKAIVVHYAGVACEMDAILPLANNAALWLSKTTRTVCSDITGTQSLRNE